MSFNTIKVNNTDTNYTHSIFDISDYNSGATYTDLSAALSAIPESKLHGGMSIKFVTPDTPARYSVVKTENLTTELTGTLLSEAPYIDSGTYDENQLSTVFSTLPSEMGASHAVTYYVAVTVDETTTYTSWVITKLQNSDNKYVQYICTADSFVTDKSQWQIRNGEIIELEYDEDLISAYIKQDGSIADAGTHAFHTLTYSVSLIENKYFASGRVGNAEDGCSIAYYDAEQNFLGYELPWGSSSASNFVDYVLTIPANTAYIKICGRKPGTSLHIEATVKSNFTEIEKLKEQHAANIEEVELPAEATQASSFINIYGSLYVDETTTAFTTKTYKVLGFTDFIASGRLGINVHGQNGCSIAYYDAEQNFLGYELPWGSSSASDFVDYVLTIPANTAYIKICGREGTTTLKAKTDLEGNYAFSKDIKETIQELDFSLRGKNVVILGDSISTHGNSGINANAVEVTITTSDVGIPLKAYVTEQDVLNGLTLGGTTYTNADIGNEVYFTPTAEDVGKRIGLPINYNSNSLKVWWTYVRDYFECNIIPVCWSGSGLTRNRNNSTHYINSYAWHDSQIRKCGIRRPSTLKRIAPDVIIITRGGNDFSHSPFAMLTDGYFDNYDVQYPDTDLRQDGEYGFKEAYFMTIGKLRETYPSAKIILCTYPVMKRINHSHFPMNNGYYSEPQYNDAVREIADFCGCDIIEFDKCGITWENMYPKYINDSETKPTHPNAKGHEVMGKYAIKALKNISFDLL